MQPSQSFGFRRRRRDVRQATSCECNACVRIPDLNLKFVVHHGLASHQKMAGRDELMGSDVIVVHRLLKNDVVGQLGASANELITQSCIDAMAIDPAALGMTAIAETYEVIGEVRAWVLDLERRWQEEDGRQRLRVTTAQAMYTASVPTSAPPQTIEFEPTPAGTEVQFRFAPPKTARERAIMRGGGQVW